MTTSSAADWRQDPMTERQAKLLLRLGADVAPAMTKGEASAEIEARGGGLRTETIQAVECPTCGVPAGLACRRASGTLRAPHRHREGAARKVHAAK